MKKKIKLKRKNSLIFITCIVFIITSICYGISIFDNTKKQTKVDKTKENINLNKLENIDQKIDYFNYDYVDRYIAYQKENKDLEITQVITEVNIGLDNPYYTNTKKSKYLNKPQILVNKYNYLTEDYIPKNLEDISTEFSRNGMKLINYAREAFEQLAQAAKKENMTIIAMSSYRSYIYQENLYNKYVSTDGKEAADSYSARPGYSEHQTGLAVDIYNGDLPYTSFEQTKEFKWMQKNSYKYGFILRFPQDKTKQTGYQYESWHYRYVGKEIAKYIHKNNICYEEYYAQYLEKNKG